LADIPFGATTSYGRQAAALGIPTAARAIGAANGANPVCIVLPCHRVIGANGSLTGFGGGLPTKQWLLDHEARVLSHSPSPVPGEGRGGGASSIVSTPEWPHQQPLQTRLSMPVA
jgi:methylated-DNA-[protein]-cysteine S-methyltransferase